MNPFIYTALPVRVIFGRGKVAETAAEARRLGIRRPLVITTPHQAESAAGIVKETEGVGFAGAAMHTYSESIVNSFSNTSKVPGAGMQACGRSIILLSSRLHACTCDGTYRMNAHHLTNNQLWHSTCDFFMRP